MKKAIFAIYVRDNGQIKIDDVNGYILDYGRFRFGIRKFGQWSITELSTGMLIGLYADRKKDIIPLLDNNINLLDTLQKKLDNPDTFVKVAQEMIRNHYTVQPAE